MTVERTELRKQFFAETTKDPYAFMISRLAIDMWIEGYKQACIETGNKEKYFELDLLALRDKAASWITDEKRKAEAQMIIAMAQIGQQLDKPPE